MSWLLGSSYKQSQQPPLNSGSGQLPPGDNGGNAAGGPPTGGGEPPKLNKNQMEAYRFDSTGLERAAAAAKELERSPNSKSILELTKLQEVTKQEELQTERKKYEGSIEQLKIEQKRLEVENRSKIIQEETKHQQMRAQYQDQLARKRYDDQLLQQQKVNDENLRRQEESIAKQEAMRKATLDQEMANKKAIVEHEMALRHQNDMKKLKAEIDAKGKIDRENHDINMEKIKLQAAEHRATVLESIKARGAILSSGATALVNDWNKVVTTVGGLSLLALGFFAAKHSTGVTARYIEARLTKPSIVRETSRISPVDVLRHPIQTIKKLKPKSSDALQGIVLAPKLEEKLRDIAITTKLTKINNGKYRNLLLFGPPGTGKTMFARKLAQHSGMDYAILTGGDLVRLGTGGVTDIQKTFDWAKASRKGLLLFIDEADAFLHKRLSVNMSENLRSMLNAFLHQTGEQSDKFMLVLASNVPEQFDRAIMNRLHKSIEFPLPGREERERLIRMYFDKFVLQPAAENKLKITQFDYSALCSQMADLTEGLSGRELEQLGIEWQATAYAQEDRTLTENIIIDSCKEAIEEYRRKRFWDCGFEQNETNAPKKSLAASI